MQTDQLVLRVFHVIASGSADSREIAVNTNIFEGVEGHANKFQLRETAKSRGIELLGNLRQCTRCSATRGYRKPITNRTKSLASQNLGRDFFYVSGTKRTPSLLGKKNVAMVKDDLIRPVGVDKRSRA